MVLLKMVLFVDMQTDLAVEKKAVKRSSGELTNNSVSIFLFYSYRIGRKEMIYLTTHSTHFIYSYIASDIW